VRRRPRGVWRQWTDSRKHCATSKGLANPKLTDFIENSRAAAFLHTCMADLLTGQAHAQRRDARRGARCVLFQRRACVLCLCFAPPHKAPTNAPAPRGARFFLFLLPRRRTAPQRWQSQARRTLLLCAQCPQSVAQRSGSAGSDKRAATADCSARPTWPRGGRGKRMHEKRGISLVSFAQTAPAHRRIIIGCRPTPLLMMHRR
jgi:hypothetical protein